MIVVHTVIPNKTQWLFSNLAYFRAKNRLQSSANGDIFVFHACVYVVQLVSVRMRSDVVLFVCYLGPTGPVT